jgi:mannose/fructose/N-acetylgalactosamine-specific phosphotransferase system component IIC
MNVTLLQALAVAFLAYFGISTWVAGIGYFTTYRPLIGGTLVGWVLGDVVQGMQIGAAINAMYLGFISTGGSLPSDLIIAGYLGTALAMIAGLDPQTAVSMVVPLGLLGSAIWFLRMSASSVFVHWADAAAERGDAKAVAIINVAGGQALLFLLYAVPTFLAVYYGADAVQSLVARIPAQWVTGLAMVGGMLPAVGIGMLLNYTGRPKLIPFFLMGYLAATYLDLPILVIAILGGAAAYLHTQYAKGEAHGAE